jgi:hypothetical protein
MMSPLMEPVQMMTDRALSPGCSPFPAGKCPSCPDMQIRWLQALRYKHGVKAGLVGCSQRVYSISLVLSRNYCTSRKASPHPILSMLERYPYLVYYNVFKRALHPHVILSAAQVIGQAPHGCCNAPGRYVTRPAFLSPAAPSAPARSSCRPR